MTKLIEERMEAERQQREVEQQRRHLQELEDERKACAMNEKQRIENELMLKEEEEQRERLEELERIKEVMFEWDEGKKLVNCNRFNGIATLSEKSNGIVSMMSNSRKTIFVIAFVSDFVQDERIELFFAS